MGAQAPGLIVNQTHLGIMATLILALLLHFAGLTEPEQNPTPATYAAASQADGGGTDWNDC
jgi:hypothetical protein